MAAMAKLPVMTAPSIVCAYCQSAHGLRMSAHQLFSTISPVCSNSAASYPTGCCIQALVATIR